ncbi:MAG: arsenic resistance protein [Pseudomonadota bacterium]
MTITDANQPSPSGVSTRAGLGVTALLISAIIAGSMIGLSSATTGEILSSGIDQTLLVLISLLFFEVRLRSVAKGFTNFRFIGLALAANYLIVPLIGFAIASLFLTGQPLLFTGLMIYFLAPCTDWFLGFTRMAKGNTALGAALLPINMIVQLLLYPLWLWGLTRHMGVVDFAGIPNLLLQWFLLPFVAAQVARALCAKVLSAGFFQRLTDWIGLAIPFVTAALILQIFAGNISTIADHAATASGIVLAILLFFVATFLVSEILSRLFQLKHPEHALLTMTTAARNAPLMLAVTAVAIPDQPLVYMALIVGMIAEFPHLTALKQLLLAQAARKKRSNDTSLQGSSGAHH